METWGGWIRFVLELTLSFVFIGYGLLAAFEYIEPFSPKFLTLGVCTYFAGMFWARRAR